VQAVGFAPGQELPRASHAPQPGRARNIDLSAERELGRLRTGTRAGQPHGRLRTDGSRTHTTVENAAARVRPCRERAEGAGATRRAGLTGKERQLPVLGRFLQTNGLQADRVQWLGEAAPVGRCRKSRQGLLRACFASSLCLPRTAPQPVGLVFQVTPQLPYHHGLAHEVSLLSSKQA